MTDFDFRLTLRIAAVALAVCGCGAGKDQLAGESPAIGAPLGRVEQATIHPDFPEFSFTLHGEESAATISVERIEIRRGADATPLQIVGGLETETPLNPGEPLLEIVDMNFDGYGDFRIIEFLPAGPNVPYLNWLYQPQAGAFVRAEELDALPAPAYDAETRTVLSSWRDGAAHYGFDTYEWVDGQPVAIRKELHEYREPGVYERTVSEPQGEGWRVIEREMVRE